MGLLEQIDDILRRHYTITLYTLAKKLEISKNDLLGYLLKTLDEDYSFCYIFAKNKDNLYITKYSELIDFIAKYIYNPIKEKFELFFKDGHLDYPNWINTIGPIPRHDTTGNWCRFLTSITIPNSVTSIKNEAFRATHLKYIKIPESVTSIGKGAFEYCSDLTSIIIPNSVTSIGDNAFKGCEKVVIYTKNPYVIDYCKENNIEYKED